jgi:protein phosphatase
VTSAPPTAAASHSPLRVVAAGKSDVGRVRDHNEDTLLVRPALGLFVVADGMGGHNAGEVASALAAVSVENFVAATLRAPIPDDLGAFVAKLPEVQRRLVAALVKANADIFEISRTHREHKGMGTTIVAVHAPAGSPELCIAHVGDSRCYRVRDGEITQLTRDHSLVSDAKAWKPDITPEELAALPKNVISRALGRARSVEVDVRTEALREDDVYLLCSDGLSGMVDDDVIRDVVGMEAGLDEVCDTLIALANDAGGTDNVTVLSLRVERAG